MGADGFELADVIVLLFGAACSGQNLRIISRRTIEAAVADGEPSAIYAG